MPDPATPDAGRSRRSDGQRTHAAILDAATRVASVEGIEGLTIGRLAEELGVSKSGVYAHFGSKTQLQLETLAAAEVVFDRHVLGPARRAPAGMARLRALAEAYLSYVEEAVFPGGCFFASLLAEMDARAGPVHDQVLTGERAWQDGLADEARTAQRQGELAPEADPGQIAFELQALLELSNYHFVLFQDRRVVDRGRRAVDSLLERAGSAGRSP